MQGNSFCKKKASINSQHTCKFRLKLFCLSLKFVDMNRNQRGRERKQKGSVLRTEKSASRTEEMVVKP